MTVEARCVRCRGPLGPDGLCPSCDAADARVAERLRALKDEIAAEREGAGGGASDAGKAEAPAPERKKKLFGRKAPSSEADGGGRKPPTDTPPAAKEPPGKPPEGGPSVGEPPPGKPPVRTPAENAPTPPPDAAVPPRVWSGVSDSGIRAREVDLGHPHHGREAVAQLLEHRRKGLGKIIGLAGLPRHGKTKLADRLRERAAERPGADLRYDKTEVGEVNIYYLPGQREHHVLIDVAGEDFRLLGDYERPLPGLMENFLWPVLQEIDGLLLLKALPIVWSEWNDAREDRRQEPAERDEIGMREARKRMVEAHRMLLKYAMVARDLKRLRKKLPQLGLDPAVAPTRNQVDDAFKTAARLDAPVAVAFSKADLYAAGRRCGLYTPDLPSRPGQPAPPLHPERTDPWILGYLHFPELFDFLMDRVRHFTFDFVQALEDRSAEPDVQEARDADAGIETLRGAEALVEFVTQHPWGVPGLSTAAAVRIDRLLDRDRWESRALRRLHEPPRPGSRRGPGRGGDGRGSAGRGRR